MNRKVTDCDIVLELLPLYIEQKTGEESNAFVAKHLAECEDCREVYKLMNADLMKEGVREGGGGTVVDATQVTEANTAKGFSFTDKKIFLVAAGLLAYLGLMVGLVIYTFMYLTGM